MIRTMTRTRRIHRHRRPSHRLALEVLETRLTPSAFTVSSTFDLPDDNPGDGKAEAIVNTGNGSAMTTTGVDTSADLAVTLTDAPDPVKVGDLLAYTVTLSNNGPNDASNIHIIQVIPAGTTFDHYGSSSFTSSSFDPALGAYEPVQATLAAGASVEGTVFVRVNASVPEATVLTSLASIAVVDTPDDNVANNSATATATVISSADLVITKTDSPDPVNAGSDLTYTISMVNNGPSNAGQVDVSDVIPTGTTFVSATAPAGWTVFAPAVGGTGTVVFSKAVVAPGVASFTIVVHVGATVPGGTNIGNTATVHSFTFDPNRANNSASSSTIVNSVADLSLTKIDSPDPVIAGTELTYTITLRNSGPGTAQNAVMTDALPAPLRLVSASITGPPAGWTVTTSTVGANDVVSATNPGVSPGSVVNFVIVAKIGSDAPNGLVMNNTASVSSTTTDPNGSNNFGTSSTTVTTVADVAVGLTNQPDPVIAGELLQYTVALANIGPSDASGITLMQAIPAGTTFDHFGPSSFTMASFDFTSGTYVAVQNDLPARLSAQGTFFVRVNPSVPNGTVLTSTASLTASTPADSNANNSRSATTTVITSADLAVTKTDSPDPVVAGTNITYTISLTNNGPSDAQNYNVSDTLPTGTSLVSLTQSSGPAAGGVLPAGGAAAFLVVARVGPGVAAGTGLLNTASTISTTIDPNNANNTATATTTVIAVADLAVAETASPSPVTAGSNLTYSIVLTNNGPSDAQNVLITDAIPAGATFVSASAPGGWTTIAPAVGATGTVTFTRASVAAGAAPIFTIVITVSAEFPATQSVSNTVSVTSSTPDNNPSNDSFTNNTAVVSPVDLVVTKDATPNPAFPGGNLTYSVTVQNIGFAPAVNVKLYDLLPDKITFVSNSGAPGWSSTNPPIGSPGIIISTIPSFAGGATATFIIVVKIPTSVRPGTILTNRAVLTTSSFELNTANNSSSSSVAVVSSPMAPPIKPATALAHGGSSGPLSATAAAISASAQDAAIATSGGLVADVLRRRTRSRPPGFSG